jgi:hypothetical protein
MCNIYTEKSNKIFYVIDMKKNQQKLGIKKKTEI